MRAKCGRKSLKPLTLALGNPSRRGLIPCYQSSSNTHPDEWRNPRGWPKPALGKWWVGPGIVVTILQAVNQTLRGECSGSEGRKEDPGGSSLLHLSSTLPFNVGPIDSVRPNRNWGTTLNNSVLAGTVPLASSEGHGTCTPPSRVIPPRTSWWAWGRSWIGVVRQEPSPSCSLRVRWLQPRWASSR